MSRDNFAKYEEMALKVRKSILELVHKTRSPHVGPSFSIVEILVALYFDIMNASPEKKYDADRDRFILSKGHACPALYAVLFERGFLRKKDLESFAVNDGLLQQHPDKNIEYGIELSTGSLGHGLAVGAGMALKGKIDEIGYGVYTLLGDGELNEGAVWEAVIFAGHYGLDNLIAIIDHNKMQALGNTSDIMSMEPLSEKWRAFGWDAKDVNGHDFGQIFDAFRGGVKGKPLAIILHTTKGKGVSFMEDQLLWHYRPPDKEEYKLALEELDR